MILKLMELFTMSERRAISAQSKASQCNSGIKILSIYAECRIISTINAIKSEFTSKDGSYVGLAEVESLINCGVVETARNKPDEFSNNLRISSTQRWREFQLIIARFILIYTENLDKQQL